MLLDPIKKEHIEEAVKQLSRLDKMPGKQWAAYWIIVNNNQYQFKHVVRNAYELATGEKIKEESFTSSPFTRGYVKDVLGFKIVFIIPDNIPFFTKDEIKFFSNRAGKKYQTDSDNDKKIGLKLKNSVFKKTNTWLRALNLDEFEIKQDNQWQISGYFKSYSWARSYRKEAKNKKVFFTVGVDGQRKSLVYKIDCQRSQVNPKNALSKEQVRKFDLLVDPTPASWNEIKLNVVESYNWESLIDETMEFISTYISLYDEAVSLISGIKTRKEVARDFLTLTDAPLGRKKIKRVITKSDYIEPPDYEGNYRHRKKIGDAGEALVLALEKKQVEKHHPELADEVVKVPDSKGYDIYSFNIDGSPKCIEVKTTTDSKYRPFIMSRNERYIMSKQPNYHIYRLFNYDEDYNTAEYFILKENIQDLIDEEPLSYSISLKDDYV